MKKMIESGREVMGFFVEVESGVKLYVVDINPSGKETIIFLHGWPLSHKQFEYQFDILPHYGVRCIGIDWRGFGKSDKPFTGYTIDRLADDIRAVVEALGLQNIVLLGHSTGGAIAFHYVARHGSAGVKGLILLDAAVPVGLPTATAEQFINMTLQDRPHMLQELTDQFFFQYATEPFKQWFFHLGLEAAGWSTIAIMNMLSQLDLNSDIAAIDVPTLILHGLQDHIVPYAQAEQLSKQLSNAQLVPLVNGGHGAFWEDKQMVNDTILKWLGLSTL